MISYAKNSEKKGEVPAAVLGDSARTWRERFDSIYQMSGAENPYLIGQEMGELMTQTCTIVKKNEELDAALGKLQSMQERWKAVSVLDTGRTLNQAATYLNQLWNMLELAELTLRASRLRDECRGSHYKPAFQLPEPKTRDPSQDPQWMAAWRARSYSVRGCLRLRSRG